MSATSEVILPDAELRGGRRKRVYIDAEDMIAYLLKAASEPRQNPDVALFARELAMELQRGFGAHR